MRIRQWVAAFLSVCIVMPLVPIKARAVDRVIVPADVRLVQDKDASVVTVATAQSQAWKVDFNVTIKDGAGAKVYASVLRSDIYNKIMESNPSLITKFDTQTYASSDLLYGAIGSASGVNKSDFAEYSRGGKIDFASSDARQKTIAVPALSNKSPDVKEDSIAYHTQYTFVVFDDGTNLKNESDFTVGTFYIDSEGKLQTESYMLRYIKNSGSVGTTVGVNSMPAYQIEGWGTGAQVAATATASNPTRLGYTFYGWDNDHDVMEKAVREAVKDEMLEGETPEKELSDGELANEAAKLDPLVAFPRDTANKTLAWATVGGGTHEPDNDLIYDLFAIWKPVMVGVEAVSKTAGAPDTTAEQTTKAKVGVAFEWQYNATGSYSATNPRVYGGITTKTVSAQYSTDNGVTFKTGLPAGMGLATTKQDAVMTYKTLDVKPSGETGKAAFCVTGRPTEYYSTEQPITIRLTVTDKSNKTFVTQDLHLSEIEKGSQSVTPDEDVSTGLETDVAELAAPPAEGGGEVTEPAAEDTPDAPAKDGQILGFYSLGQTIPEEQGGHPNAKGSGSLREYYLNVTDPGMWNEALIYEYKPDTVEDVPANWREVPLPKEYYDKLADGSTLAKTDVETAMQKNAAVKIRSTLARGAGGKVALASETPAPVEGTPWAGWTSEYGYINWDGNGCPVVHGLTEGAKYNVRFKANGDYDSSAPVTLTITKGGGGSSGGECGPADSNDFIAWSMFDWDNQYIGTKLVPRGADQSEQSKLNEAALVEIQEEYVDVFTSHTGYDFLIWLPKDSTEPTSYGDRVVSNNSTKMAVENAVLSSEKKLISPNAPVDFSKVNTDLAIKAAYTTNSECSIDSEVNRRYVAEAVEFGRMGTTQNFTIKIRIRRGGVPRATTPYLRVTMQDDAGQQTLALYALNGSDEEFVTIVPYTTNIAGTSKVLWSIIDMYGYANANGAAPRTDQANKTFLTRGEVQKFAFDGSSSRQVVLDEENGFMHKCILGGINDALANYDPAIGSFGANVLDINANLLRSIGVGVKGASITGIQDALYQKWKEVNFSDGVRNETIRDLTRKDMMDALGSENDSAVLPE